MESELFPCHQARNIHQGAALVESDEEAVELRSTAYLQMAAKHSTAIFVGPSGERFRKNRKD